MKKLNYIARPVAAQRVAARPTTVISTTASGHQTDFQGILLYMLPDGSLGTREGVCTYDRQQTCPFHNGQD